MDSNFKLKTCHSYVNASLIINWNRISNGNAFQVKITVIIQHNEPKINCNGIELLIIHSLSEMDSAIQLAEFSFMSEFFL